MNITLGYGYLKVVLLTVLCGTVLGSPQASSTGNIEGSQDTTSSSSISNDEALLIAGKLTDIYDLLGETAKGLSECQFPFIYKGVTYFSCTTDHDHYGMFWCSTRTNENNEHVYSTWRHCKLSDGLSLEDISLTEDDSLGCVLGETTYQNGDINRDLCMYMKCNNGDWEYTGEINKDCGNCTVYGDPHFWTIDDTRFLEYGHRYKFGGVGNFVITQPGFSYSPSFGLNANLQSCNPEHAPNLSCVHSTSYKEPGITVEMVLPLQPNISDPIGEMKVIVNGELQKIKSGIKSALVFHGTVGTVLVFQHNHIEEDANFFCMNIIGSQGLSMSLCQHKSNFAWLYVLPMPTLKSNPSQLYGLCNTYTGANQDYLIARAQPMGVSTTNITAFGDSWEIFGVLEGVSGMAGSNGESSLENPIKCTAAQFAEVTAECTLECLGFPGCIVPCVAKKCIKIEE